MSGHTLDLAVNRHVNFAHARETYVIYPWVGDGDELVRPLRLGQTTGVSGCSWRLGFPPSVRWIAR